MADDLRYAGEERRLFPEWFDFYRREVLEPRLVQVERAHTELKKGIESLAESNARIELAQKLTQNASTTLAEYAAKADKLTSNKWARAGAFALWAMPLVATAALIFDILTRR